MTNVSRLFSARLPSLAAPPPAAAMPERGPSGRDVRIVLAFAALVIIAVFGVPAAHVALAVRAGVLAPTAVELHLFRAMACAALAVIAVYVVARARWAPSFTFWCSAHGGRFTSARAYPSACTSCGERIG